VHSIEVRTALTLLRWLRPNVAEKQELHGASPAGPVQSPYGTSYSAGN
jgi:hypothetical protein